MPENSDYCPCGSDQYLHKCCGVYIDNHRKPDTAEALMRSRYAAYVLGNTSYLQQSWHPDTCPDIIELDDAAHWLGLKIRSVQQGGVGDDQGQVEFVARYKINGRGYRLHEVSRFARVKGRWVYVEGDTQQ